MCDALNLGFLCTGISQRDTSLYVAHIAEEKEAIMDDIMEFFKTEILPLFPRDNCEFVNSLLPAVPLLFR